MSVVLEWTGRVPRVNSYGVFDPGKPVTVPNYVAKELLQHRLFVEVPHEVSELLNSADVEILQSRLHAALDEVRHYDNEIQKYELYIAQLENENNVLRAAQAAGPGATPDEVVGMLAANAEAEAKVEVKAARLTSVTRETPDKVTEEEEEEGEEEEEENGNE